ncbi:MAG: Cna B-type domain-containing protein [Candidatus Nanosyncoccaceae bacterium]
MKHLIQKLKSGLMILMTIVVGLPLNTQLVQAAAPGVTPPGYAIEESAIPLMVTLEGESTNVHTRPYMLWTSGSQVFMMVKSTHKIQYMEIDGTRSENLDRYEADQTIYVNGIPYANPADTLNGNIKDAHWTVVRFPLSVFTSNPQTTRFSFFVKGIGGGHDVGGYMNIEIPKVTVNVNKTWDGGPKTPVSITLYRQIGNEARQIVDRDDNPFILSTANPTKGFTNLLFTDNAGRIYIYSFEESDPGAGYEVTFSSSYNQDTKTYTFDLINTYTNPGPIVDPIELNKTATPFNGMVNEWDVKLRIESGQTQTTSDTILVIDRSGSMANYNRMKNAKVAANSLINKLLPAGNTRNRVAVVSFAGSPYNTSSDVTVNSHFTTNSTTASNAVNSLIADGGTHTQAGMRKARELIATSTANLKNIVLLSDGRPTFCYGVNSPWKMNTANLIAYPNYGWQTPTTVPENQFNNDRVGAGNSMYQRYDNPSGTSNDKWYNCGNHAIAEAGFFKTSYPSSNLYTIALSAGEEGGPVLNAMASPGKAYTAEPDELTEIFNEIAGKINNFIQSATIIDNMAPGVVATQIISCTGGCSTVNPSIINAGKTVKWEPTFTWNDTIGKYVAELVYRVRLDEDILTAPHDNDGLYPANANATITYNGESTADFPVPKIDPVFVKIKKTLGGDDCVGCKFTFRLTLPNGTTEHHTVVAGQEITLYHPMPIGNYTISEVSATDANGNSMSLDQYVISFNKTSFALALGGADQIISATNTVKTGSVTVDKKWVGVPGTKAVVTLHADSVSTGQTVELNANNEWQHTFTNLRQYNRNGSPIKYTIVETKIDGYADPEYSDNGEGIMIVNGSGAITVTNRYIPETTNVTGYKQWVGGQYFNDGKRPDIQLQLYRDGIAHLDPVTLTGGATPQLSYTWENVPKTDINGNVYTYSVDEVKTPDNYTKTKSEDGLTVINTYGASLVEVIATKTWVNGPAPVAIEFQLYRQTIAEAEPSKVGLPVTLDPGTLTYTWPNMPATDDDGRTYTYSVKEVTVLSNFNTSYGNTELDIINTYVIPKTEVTVTKKWVGGSTPRPTIQVQLYQNNGAFGDPVSLPNGTTEYTWADLDATDINGNIYTYSVDEVKAPENYIKTVNGFTITNTYKSPKIEITGTKAWVNGPTPRPNVELQLYRDGAAFGDSVTLVDGETSHTWTELDKTDSNGKTYAYTVDEVDVPTNYVKTVSEDGLTVTNTYQSPKIEITGTKAWVNGPTPRPNVELQLYRDGAAFGDSVTLVDGETSHTWTELDKTDSNGKAYKYTVDEVYIPTNYTKTISEDGLTVTNTYKSPKIEVTGKKVWVNGPIPRPDVELQLYRDGAAFGDSVTLADGETSHTWTELDKTDSNGKVYTYTVDEINVPENYIKGVDGFVITNTYESPKIEITGTKVWVNGPTPRPDVRLQLLRDGTVQDAVTLSHGTTSHTWTGLDKTDSNGKVYKYTVDEANVPTNYVKTISEDGRTVTNTYESPKADVTATKVWIGGSVLTKPDVTFQLKQNGVNYGAPVILETADGNSEISHTWKDLDINDKDGVAYEYTVEEVDPLAPWGKVSEIKLTVTNKYTSPKINIPVEKLWEGGEKVRPESIEVNLLRDGVNAGEDTLVLSEDNSWSGKWTVDETDAEGNKYVYTVEEVAVDNFTSEVFESEEGVFILNTYNIPTKDIMVKKVWEDPFATHPDAIINLLRDGEVIASQVLQNGKWFHTWKVEMTDIDGTPYTYTIEEEKLENYESRITGSLTEGFVVTNCWLEPGKGDLVVPKTGAGSAMSPFIALFALLLIALGVRGRKLAKQIA